MANVIHRTTLAYRSSVNEPDFPESIWKWNPDMAAVSGTAPKYWKAPADWNAVGAGPVVMSQAERDAVDAMEASITNLIERTAAMNLLNQRTQLAKLLKAVAGVFADELTSRVNTIGEASLVWDPPNVPNATGLTSPALTVIGAAFGDYVDVSASIPLNGIIVTGYVSTANTVVIRLHNGTGGAVNLASATWRVLVRRTVVRTMAQAKQAIVDKINSGAAD